MRIEAYVGGRWTEVEVDESWWWGSEPEDERPRRRPTYRVYCIRKLGPPDPRAAEAVLNWLRGCSPP